MRKVSEGVTHTALVKPKVKKQTPATRMRIRLRRPVFSPCMLLFWTAKITDNNGIITHHIDA